MLYTCNKVNDDFLKEAQKSQNNIIVAPNSFIHKCA